MESKSEVIRLAGVHKRFNPATINETEVFTDFNLTVYEGEFVSIVGSNGSGKTTMLNLICGSLMLDCGKILLRGCDITGAPEYRRARHIGRVFQDPARGTCPSLTILENMSLADNKGGIFGLREGINRRRLDYYKSQLELLHLGLEDKTDVLVGALSGGQRQALSLLLSTMTPIDLLVLDEHTASLDPNSSQTIMELTDRLVKERNLTTVMVTHNLRFAVDYGNRIIMMHGGKCVIDAEGAEKSAYQVRDLLGTFNEISIECGN
ncbi:MAG: ATP-binding cassette domain-containing protein [Oscillospiraceae bacterium]|nr:ATP-binding cassette domain-containing protein [Oscillospiraceae bacterium]